MASKRRVRRKQCGNKIPYSQADAIAKTWGGMHAYACKFCGHWHIGHPPAKVRQSMAARRRNARLT